MSNSVFFFFCFCDGDSDGGDGGDGGGGDDSRYDLGVLDGGRRGVWGGENGLPWGVYLLKGC